MEELSEKEKKALQAAKEQISILRSANSGAILTVLKEIRSKGSISILNEVFNVMLNPVSPEVQQACISLINDLKAKEAQSTIVDAIKAKEYKDIRKELVSSCWQSGMSYHQYIDVFIKLVEKESYSVAFEAFTVIEDCIGELSEKERSKIAKSLDSAVVKSKDQEKSKLIKALKEVVEAF